jgi:hypothetical protein
MIRTLVEWRQAVTSLQVHPGGDQRLPYLTYSFRAGMPALMSTISIYYTIYWRTVATDTICED